MREEGKQGKEGKDGQAACDPGRSCLEYNEIFEVAAITLLP